MKTKNVALNGRNGKLKETIALNVQNIAVLENTLLTAQRDIALNTDGIIRLREENDALELRKKTLLSQLNNIKEALEKFTDTQDRNLGAILREYFLKNNQFWKIILDFSKSINSNGFLTEINNPELKRICENNITIYNLVYDTIIDELMKMNKTLYNSVFSKVSSANPTNIIKIVYECIALNKQENAEIVPLFAYMVLITNPTSSTSSAFKEISTLILNHFTYTASEGSNFSGSGSAGAGAVSKVVDEDADNASNFSGSGSAGAGAVSKAVDEAVDEDEDDDADDNAPKSVIRTAGRIKRNHKAASASKFQPVSRAATASKTTENNISKASAAWIDKDEEDSGDELPKAAMPDSRSVAAAASHKRVAAEELSRTAKK